MSENSKEFFVEEEKKIEASEKRRKFADQIQEQIVNYFPFESSEEKEAIISNFGIISERSEELSDDGIVEEVRILLRKLNNSHTRLKEKVQVSYLVDHEMKYQGNGYWVKEGGEWFKIKTFNGKDIGELIELNICDNPGGRIERQRARALQNIGFRKEESRARIEIEDEGETGEVLVEFSKESEKPLAEQEKKLVESRAHGDIGYLKINSWDKKAKAGENGVLELAAAALKKLQETKSLIIDVRENSGGDDDLMEKIAGRFFQSSEEYSVCEQRIPGTNEVEKIHQVMKPIEPGLRKRLILLTGPLSYSTNESFVMSLKDTGKAQTVGETTGGGSGNPVAKQLALGGRNFVLLTSTWRRYRLNGEPLEGKGIAPDFEIKTGAEDIKAKRDPVLAKALEILKR